MSVEAVKRQILIAVDALNIPLNRVPSPSKVAEACAAAKLLRNRLLREHTRVTERIEALRERQMFDEVSDEDMYYDDDGVDTPAAGNGVSRSDFVFMCELMVAEKLVIPLLLAHGMNFADSLLPQLLKFLAVMLLPIPRYSAEEVLQKDLLQRIKFRCGTDEFFALLVQCVAPIAEKRTSGELQREDVVVLEIILTLITYLVDGNPSDAERIIGAFCRNHGIELLLVVINQNYSRTQRAAAAKEPPIEENADVEPTTDKLEEGSNNVVDVETEAFNESADVHLPEKDVPLGSEEEEIDLESDEDSLSSSSPLPKDLAKDLDRDYQEQMHNLLESDDQLWKWNCLSLASIASVIRCVPSEEVAQLTMLDHSNVSTPDQLLGILRNSQQFRDCKKNSDRWRFVAKSRNGSVTSNGILVHGSGGSGSGGRAIGTVSSLLGSRRKDPIEVMREVDLRKRGRFIKGMYQEAAPQCNLPLPTKIQLSQQTNSFLSFGFELLSVMTFSKLQEIAISVERATKEHREVVAGYRGSGEKLEVSSPIDTVLYQKLRHVLDFMCICRCTVRYVRVIVEQLKVQQVSYLAMFPQQWQSVSSIISLDYLELGFSVLRSFLDCKDIRRREDVANVVGYLSEILLMLNLLLQGDIATDPAVEVAAHALASSVLYKEENIKVVFGLLTEYSSRVIAIRKAQVFTLFTFSVFQLMEKCSYKGQLLLPKRPKRQRDLGNVSAAEAADMGGVDHRESDNESVDSATLGEMQGDMLRDIADMIDDTEEYGEEHRHSRADAALNDKGMSGGQSAVSAVLGEQSVMVEEAEVPIPEPIIESLESEHFAQHKDDDGQAVMSERAFSEGRPPSIASSGRTALSTMSSEREVAVSGYVRRLATPKNIGLIYSALRHWRVNDADVNLGLTFLIKCLLHNECETIFFNVAFLLVMREVLVHGEKTHAPLYAVCDRIVYDFFNPPYAKILDARNAVSLPEEVASGMLNGAQSHLGFEVGLRCTRALFNFSSTDYAYLEEKGMPHLMDHTVIPLPNEESNRMNARYEDFDGDAAAPALGTTPDATAPSGAKSRHKKKKTEGRRDKKRKDDAGEEEEEEELAISSASDNENEDAEETQSPGDAADGAKEKHKKKRKDRFKKHHHEHGDQFKKKKHRHRGDELLTTIALESKSDPNAQILGEFAALAEEPHETAAAMEIASATEPLYNATEETLVIEGAP